MAGYNRPEGGWNYVFDGINVLDAPDALQPTQYPLAKNIRGLADRSVRTRPGYTLFSTSPTITTECPLTPATEDSAYSETITASGGIPPYTWSIASGALPSGLSINSSTGEISGTPTTSGLFEFVILVTDAAGGTDTLSCSLYVCSAGAGNTDWSGCLAGSFSVASDWSLDTSCSISNGLLHFTGLGGAQKTGGGVCGSSLNQEIYAVYNGKTSGGAGSVGYRAIGPGLRCGGSSIATRIGYYFTARMYSGTITGAGICGNIAGPIFLELFKVNAGVITTLAVDSISGFDLTVGIPFDMQCTDESGDARILCFLGGTQIFNYLDSSSPLGLGTMGFASLVSCTGIPPADVTFNFVKGRLL